MDVATFARLARARASAKMERAGAENALAAATAALDAAYLAERQAEEDFVNFCREQGNIVAAATPPLVD